MFRYLIIIYLLVLNAKTMSAVKRMPAIFFGHGSPMNALENNKYTKAWIDMASSFPKPKAIVVISAHWETNGVRVTSNLKQETIHDFGGFPDELFQVKYNANGDIELAKRIKTLIPEVQFDDSWGLDHGTWSILRHIYPKADVPVIQLSIDQCKSNRGHYDIAKKLQVLRDEGVMIMASGNVVHNLRMVKWHGGPPYQWNTDFNTAIKSAMLSKDHEKIINYMSLPGARESVPTSEHFIPLIYIAGVQKDDETVEAFAEGLEMGSLSMMSFIIR